MSENRARASRDELADQRTILQAISVLMASRGWSAETAAQYVAEESAARSLTTVGFADTVLALPATRTAGR